MINNMNSIYTLNLKPLFTYQKKAPMFPTIGKHGALSHEVTCYHRLYVKKGQTSVIIDSTLKKGRQVLS